MSDITKDEFIQMETEIRQSVIEHMQKKIDERYLNSMSKKVLQSLICLSLQHYALLDSQVFDE